MVDMLEKLGSILSLETFLKDFCKHRLGTELATKLKKIPTLLKFHLTRRILHSTLSSHSFVKQALHLLQLNPVLSCPVKVLFKD